MGRRWKMSPEAEAEHERDTVGLYLQAFALHWDRLLGDIVVNSAKSYDDALRTLSILSSPTSPIRLLVVSAGAETTLVRPQATRRRRMDSAWATRSSPSFCFSSGTPPASPPWPTASARSISANCMR